MNFNEIDLSENLKKAIDEMGFTECTPVQEETFKLTIEDKKDVLAQSQTGTGKTAAFLIPIFHLFCEDENYKGGKALIIVPTRELALQVEKEAERLSTYLDFNILAVYGGVGYQKQEKELEKGVDVVIATPGRLIDFKKSGKIDMKEFNILVIDEADRLFDMGFLPDLTYILKAMRGPSERMTMLFSATLGTRVGNLSWEFMNEPGEIIIEPEHVTIDLVKQELYHVGRDEKMSLLLGLIKKYSPQSAVIFTNTKGMAYEVSRRLEGNGYKSRYLIGDLPQNKRTAVMDSMKRGEIPFLVATDVAARGLHINDLEMVFNYDIPDEAESYVHRIGRTGRAGKEGHAISLACENYVLGLPSIESLIEMKIPVVWADDESFAEDATAGQRFRLDDTRGDRDRGRSSDRRGGRGSRDDNRGDGRGDGRGRDNRNGGRGGRGSSSGPRKRDDSRAASIVDMAAGSMDNFGSDSGQGRKKSSGGGNRNRPQNNKPRGRKPADNRTRPVESSISGDLSVEDRLAYYKKKYGDDFKPTDDMLKSDKKKSPSGKKQGGGKKPSGQKSGNAPRGNGKGSNSQDRNRNRQGQGKNSPNGGKGNQNKGNGQGQNKAAASAKKKSPEQVKTQKPQEKPRKVSLLKKLFGKK
ncbi:MAG: DEAD/DEAH box helicase [Spirochaetales bacterium]|nr:DEAD/DEAH box helicase [Spirochaetales bacterium]